MQSHIIAAIAEFVGTFMFLFLAFAGHLMAISQAPVTVKGAMDNQTVIIIGLAYAISLLVNVWAFYRISGGLFNPAVCHPVKSQYVPLEALNNDCRLTCLKHR